MQRSLFRFSLVLISALLFLSACSEDDSPTDPLSAENTPILISPAQGKAVLQDAVSFRWSRVEGALNYHIQISRIASVEDGGVIENVLNKNEYKYDALSASEIYYWRVKAETINGWGAWSEIWTFKVLQDVSADYKSIPVLVFPSNGDSVPSDTVSFQWSSPSETFYYNFQLCLDVLFENSTIVDEVMSKNEFTYTMPAQGEIYYWRVRAGLPGDWGNWSDPSTFRISQEATTTDLRQYESFSIHISGVTLSLRSWSNSNEEYVFEALTLDKMIIANIKAANHLILDHGTQIGFEERVYYHSVVLDTITGDILSFNYYSQRHYRDWSHNISRDETDRLEIRIGRIYRDPLQPDTFIAAGKLAVERCLKSISDYSSHQSTIMGNSSSSGHESIDFQVRNDALVRIELHK